MPGTDARSPIRVTSLVLLVGGGAVAAGFAVWAYVTPLTGVTGTVGALLAALGGVCLVVGGALLGFALRGALRGILLALLILAAVCTALAGWFLLVPGIAAGGAVALLGAVLAAAAPGRGEARA